MRVNSLLPPALAMVCIGCAVEQRARISCIASVRIVEDGTVVVQGATRGERSGLMLLDSQRNAVQRVTLSPGDAFTLFDGRHVAKIYEFLELDGARAVFEERTWHRPPNGPSEETVKRISVGSY